MKSAEYNFQLKQCGLYKAPPFQVRWGNIKLFYNGYIVCTQKTIWIHVSCQASFGIFSKRGKLSFLQRKPLKETSAPSQLSPCFPQNVREHTYLFTHWGARCQETETCTDHQWWLNWDDYGIVPFSRAFLQKCSKSSLNAQYSTRYWYGILWGRLER